MFIPLMPSALADAVLAAPGLAAVEAVVPALPHPAARTAISAIGAQHRNTGRRSTPRGRFYFAALASAARTCLSSAAREGQPEVDTSQDQMTLPSAEVAANQGSLCTP